LVPWPSIDIHRKFYGDRPRGTPPTGGLNAGGTLNDLERRNGRYVVLFQRIW